MRSRWVAKEYNTGPRPDLFSAASALEGVKLVISEAASCNQKGIVLLVIDARRAYFHAKARRRVYIELPKGDGGEEDQAVGSAGCLERACPSPAALLKTGIASLEASWLRLACAGDKRALACTPKRRGESALQSMVMMSLSKPQGKMLSG